MTLPASLQSIRSLPQFLTVVGSVDANHDGYLNETEARALFLPAEEPQFLDWYSGADSEDDMFGNHLTLSEIAGAMSRSGPPLNKLFSTDVLQSLKDIQHFKDTTLAYTPLRAAWVNEWADTLQSTIHLKEMFVATARGLNWMFEEGAEGKKFCRNYIDELSPKALFLLLAHAGSDLWPPLFTQVSKRLESVPGLQDVVKAADPHGDLLPAFFMQMVAYGRGHNYLSRIKDPIYAAVTETVHSQDVYLVPSLLPALEALAKSSKKTADELGDTLLRYYNASGDSKVQMGFQFVMHALKKYWRSSEVRAVASDQTELETPPVPESWLSDGVLWAVVLFVRGQEPHRLRMIQMFQQRGFFQVRATGDAKTKERVVFEKKVKGTVLRLDILYSPKESNDYENSFHFSEVVRGEADIIVVRAHHSSALHYLSQCSGCEMAGKLVFNGGCTGVDNLPELMRAYRGNFFIADKNTGKGHDNSLVLYHVMHAVARGATDWEQVHRRVRAQVPVNQWGLLLPDDDLLKFYYTLDAPVFLSEVKDPFAAVEPPKKKKGKLKLGKLRVLRLSPLGGI